MISYIKILDAMCDVNTHFRDFMCTGSKHEYYQFIDDVTDGKFNVIINNSVFTVSMFEGMTKACFYVEGASTIAKVGFSEYKINHVMRELQVYAEAEKEDMAEFFVYTHYLGHLYNVDVIEQDFVECDSEGYSVVNDMYEKCSDSMSNEEIADALEYSDIVANLFPFYYSPYKVDGLLEFLDDNKVNDLHYGNMGYDNNGNLKLIDFSGYFPEFRNLSVKKF